MNEIRKVYIVEICDEIMTEWIVEPTCYAHKADAIARCERMSGTASDGIEQYAQWTELSLVGKVDE